MHHSATSSATTERCHLVVIEPRDLQYKQQNSDVDHCCPRQHYCPIWLSQICWLNAA